MFPSPCGDYGSYQDGTKHYYSEVTADFPSPYGDYGSYQYTPNVGYREIFGFPSPCGDYGSYPNRPDRWTHSRQACFRPLTGIMVLIRTLYKWLHEAVEIAFCGANHIFSSFFVFCKKMIFKKSFRTEF